MKRMIFRTWACACALALVALTACGGGGGGGAAATAGGGGTAGGSLTVGANLGVVSGGTVTAFKWVKGKKGAQLASCTTTQSGTCSLNVGGYVGDILLELTNATGNATWLNEATGAFVNLGNVKVQSVIPAGSTTAAITPLTDLVAAALMKKTNPTTADIQQTATYVAGLMGLNGTNILTTLPANIGNPSTAVQASTKAKQYARVLAGLAKLAKVNASNPVALVQLNYAPNIFNAKGNPAGIKNIPPAVSLAKLHQNVNNYAPPAGSNFATLPTPPTPAASALGKSYWVLYQSFQNNDANADQLEIDTVTLPATNGGNATPTALHAWNNAGVTTSVPVPGAFTINPDGSWSFGNTLGGNMSFDGQVFAGVNIVQGATQTNMVFGVQKPATNVTPAQLAGKTFDFVSQGSAIQGAVATVYYDKGDITFNANGTATVNLWEMTGGNAPFTRVTPAGGATFNYTIQVNGLIKLTDPATAGWAAYIGPSANGKYGVFAEVNVNNATGRVFKNAGFAILRSNVTPNAANLAYHYFTVYHTTNSSLISPANATPPNSRVGEQAEQGLVMFGPASNGSATGAVSLVAMQLQFNDATTPANGQKTVMCAAGTCPGPNPPLTFTGQANGQATVVYGGGTMFGFVSQDGNVAIFPGLIAIKQ